MTKLQIKGLSVLALVTAALCGLAGFGGFAQRGWMFGAVLAAAVEGLASFVLFNRSLEKSDRFFYSVLGGGMLVRLSTVGVLAALLSHYAIPPATPLLTLILAFFVFSVTSLPFLAGSIHGFHRDTSTSLT